MYDDSLFLGGTEESVMKMKVVKESESKNLFTTMITLFLGGTEESGVQGGSNMFHFHLCAIFLFTIPNTNFRPSIVALSSSSSLHNHKFL